MAQCPHCRGAAAPRRDNPYFPFCSERCKAIDLGRWFGGGYRVPGESAPEELAAAAPVDEADQPPSEEAPKGPRRKRRLN